MTSSPQPTNQKGDLLMRIVSFSGGLLVYLFMSRVVFDHIENGLLRIGVSMLVSFAVFIGITLTVLAIINARSSRR